MIKMHSEKLWEALLFYFRLKIMSLVLLLLLLFSLKFKHKQDKGIYEKCFYLQYNSCHDYNLEKMPVSMLAIRYTYCQ